VNLNQLADDVLQVVRLDAARRSIKLDLEVTAEMPPVWGDRVQLQQVILNLILNAMEAMSESPATGRRVVLRMSREDSGVQIAVTDAGPGIDPAYQSRIFDRFFQAHSRPFGPRELPFYLTDGLPGGKQPLIELGLFCLVERSADQLAQARCGSG